MPELTSGKKEKQRHEVHPEHNTSAIKLKHEEKPESRISLSRLPKGNIKNYQTWAFCNSGGQT